MRLTDSEFIAGTALLLGLSVEQLVEALEPTTGSTADAITVPAAAPTGAPLRPLSTVAHQSAAIWQTVNSDEHTMVRAWREAWGDCRGHLYVREADTHRPSYRVEHVLEWRATDVDA